MDNKQYRILAIDDHPVVLEGIRLIVTQIEGVVCDGLTCIKDLKDTLRKEEYDMYILDLEYPDADGFSIINMIRTTKPDSRIVIYSMHEEPWVLAKLVDLEIDGVLSKNVGTAELCRAVETIKNGSTYFNEAFLELVGKKASCVPSSNGNAFKLSVREKEILTYLTHGMSSAEIAERMFLSINTIQTYRKRLMMKLKAKNVAELVMKGKDLL